VASLPRTPKSKPPQLKAHAQREERSGRLGRAIELLEELLRQSPYDWTAVQRLANLRARNGDRRAAVDLFRRLAEHYEQDGHFSRAIAVWRIVLRQDPASLGTHARLGELYAGQGFRIEARRHYETAIAGFKRQHRAHEAARFQGLLDELDGTGASGGSAPPSAAPTCGVDDARAEGSVPSAPSAEAPAGDSGEGFDPAAADEQEFVAERLVVAKMFRRYNLLPQAREALDSLLQRAPDNVEARKELVEVLRDAGETEEAAEEQRRLAAPETAPGSEVSKESVAGAPGHPVAVMVPVPSDATITDASETLEIELEFPDEGIRDEHALAAQDPVATVEPEGKPHAFALDDILEEVFEGAPAQGASDLQPGESAAEMPLDDVVRLFREGVDQQLGRENYEARYDLGIAYREMGLLDEAIAEFQLAARGEGRQVECASLLAGCFLEKGLPELSVKWLERGLATPGAKEEEQTALRYELGHALETAGRTTRALEVFTELYGDAAGYRDVAIRVERLRTAGCQTESSDA